MCHICCHDKRMLAATKLLLPKKMFVTTKYFYHNKGFVATKKIVVTSTLVSRQTCVCCNKIKLVATNFCHDKHMFTPTKVLSQHKRCDKTFVTTNILLSRQKIFFVMTNTFLSQQTLLCRDKTFVTTKMTLAAVPANARSLPCLGDLTLEAHLSCPPERALRTSGSRGSRGRSPGCSSWQASGETCWRGRPRQSWPQTPAGWRRRTWGPSAETQQHKKNMRSVSWNTATPVHHEYLILDCPNPPPLRKN